VLDKTGTITEGKPQLVTLVPVGQWSDATLLSFAASLEAASEHPLAQAMMAAAVARGSDQHLPVANFESITGKGICGLVDGREVAIGNESFMTDKQISYEAYSQNIEDLRQDAQTAILVAVEGKLAGILGIKDPIKATTVNALNHLRGIGIRLLMLTGDHRATAEAIAQQVGINEVHAGLMPGDKQAIVAELQRSGHSVAMAGDGVNDAPALAQANVGIAMGTGTDIAMQSAGITLVKGDLMGIVRAKTLSTATMRNIKQNLFFAFAYNAFGIPVAAGILYPWFGVLLSPMIASAAMSLSSVSVIANALRLRKLPL
jgi:Cu+-exporting ATPase